MREAMFWETLDSGKLKCRLCPHNCTIGIGHSGICRGRKNIDAKLYATNYALHIGMAIDPIEKKPLYHYHPGSQILSLGANSCNLDCFFCQNHHISKSLAPTSTLSPQALLELALANNCTQIAFTYTEPFTWYEYILDFAILSKDSAIDIVLVTNAFVNPQPLKQLLPYISAMNIDLKSINPAFYKEHCKGDIEPVLANIRSSYEAGVHIEICTLLVPGLNDSIVEIEAIAAFIASINPRIPLHLSAYHPAYKARIPATSAKEVFNACKQASQILSFVYAGNTVGSSFKDTLCPSCGKSLVKRGYTSTISCLNDNCRCPACAEEVYGKF